MSDLPFAPMQRLAAAIGSTAKTLALTEQIDSKPDQLPI
jgi:hypothetical protein